MPDQPSVEVSEEAVEAAARRRYERGHLNPDGLPWREAVARRFPEVDELRAEARDDLQALAPAIAAKAVEAERQRLAHGGEPDISPGDVIAAEPDGTITLDDGITTWNPARATAFLIDQAIQKERERLRGAVGDLAGLLAELREWREALSTPEPAREPALAATLDDILAALQEEDRG
jgi:hypothetical protein